MAMIFDTSWLTAEERKIIQDNPFGDSLSIVRQALVEAEGSTAKDADADDEPERPRLYMGAISKLFSQLSASLVTAQIAPLGSNTLGHDLAELRARYEKGQLDVQQFRALSTLVIDEAPDVDIWIETLTLIHSISYSAPPGTTQSSRDETPINHSSASQQGSEQTRGEIEPRVFEEIRDCTHRAVKGYHEKFFRGRKWNTRADRAWTQAKTRYNDKTKRWTQLPRVATEHNVCRWILGVQDDLLSDERLSYQRSSGSNQVGVNPSRQIDLLVKRKKNTTPTGTHAWEEILVVGELKQSNKKNKALWLQVSSTVRNVFAAQPTRHFVHAFTLTGSELETWVFDRSGPYSGEAFDIHNEPKKFIEVLCGYLMMSDEELGLDTITKEKENKVVSVTLPVEVRGKKRDREFELDPKHIAHQRAIVCQGTSCFLAKLPGAAKFDKVVKFSWTSSKRPPESDLLGKANERGVKGLATLIAHSEVTSIEQLRSGLDFSQPHKFRNVRGSGASSTQLRSSQRKSLSQIASLSVAAKRKSSDVSSESSKRSGSGKQARGGASEVSYAVEKDLGTSLFDRSTDNAPFENRILRVLVVSLAGRSIRQFESSKELLESLRDAIKAHRSLYMDGKILHRDISENNIIITNDSENPDDPKGMLIDLDLAKEQGQGSSGARQRTGTMEFMAIDVLLGNAHTYRHDLESFFYVLLWLCARRSWDMLGLPREHDSELHAWYSGTYRDIARAKTFHMVKSESKGLSFILAEFPDAFEYVKPLCRKIRDILFPTHHDGAMFTGTPKDPEVLYGPIIKAFEDVTGQKP